MCPAIPVDYPDGGVVAHHAGAARMAKVEFDIVRKEREPPLLEPLRQELADAGSPVSQFLLDRVLDEDAVGFAIVDYDSILAVRHVLNDAHEDRSRSRLPDSHSRRYPQQWAEHAELTQPAMSKPFRKMLC